MGGCGAPSHNNYSRAPMDSWSASELHCAIAWHNNLTLGFPLGRHCTGRPYVCPYS